MRLVFLIDGLGFGGAQRQMANLAVEMKKDGHQIFYIVYQKDMFYKGILDRAEIEPICIIENNSLARLLKIRREIKKLNPDCLISFMGTPNFIACFSSFRRHNWKVIISERSTNKQSFISKKQKIMKLFSRIADYIVCNSFQSKDLWEEYYPKYANKLRTIYNIIEIKSPQNNVLIGKKEGSKVSILVAARYEKEKNLEGLIDAVSILSESEREKIEIYWYGKINSNDASRSYYNRMNDLIQCRNLNKCIFLFDAVSNINEYMEKSDYVALFSFIEGLPNSILEAMALGKPIIISSVSDYKALVDGQNGTICDPSDTDSIVASLRFAITKTQEERYKMGEHSKVIFNRICSKESILNQWRQLLK